MRILFISERFAPENTVAAIRMTKIAKYLKRKTGASISVVTRKKDETVLSDTDLSFVDNFIYIDESFFARKLIRMYKAYAGSSSYSSVRREEIKKINRQKKDVAAPSLKIWARSVLAVLWSEYSARTYKNAAKEKLKQKYDIIISSFGPEASHYIGRYYKHKHPETVWIADYRDPLYSGEATKGFLKYWALDFPNRVTGKADAVTTVSKGFVKCLNIENNKNVYVITNGFDKEDITGVSRSAKPDRKMELVYVGSLLIGRRDITPVLRALSDLISAGKIEPDRVRLTYAGGDWKEFDLQISDVGLPVEVNNLHKIPKSQALQLEVNADLLLMAAWNTREYTGSLPLKLYEYMMAGRPIICCVSGNQADSEIKEIIDRCKVGFCYEDMQRDERHFAELKNYILDAYTAFCQNRSDQMQGRCEEEIEKYDYEKLAEDFLDIYRKIKIGRNAH